MRVTGWDIEHFQGLRGVRNSLQLPSAGGITVIHGPNEAGKSTLLKFIHAMLFSTDSTSRRAGVGAGSLMVESNGVRYRVRRDLSRRGSAAMTDETGAEIDLRELQTMLAGVDHKAFKAIFAFGLSELQTFQSLTEDGVQERIFAAGVSGADGSARTAMTTLRTAAEGLLRPRALDATLNALAAKLTGVIQAQKRGLEQAAQYGQLLEREADLTAQIAQHGIEMSITERELRRLEIVLGIWPAWNDAKFARAEFDALPVTPIVPRKTLDFLRESRHLEQQLVSQQLEMEGQLIDLSERGFALRALVNPQLIAAGVTIRALFHQRVIYQDCQTQISHQHSVLRERQLLFETQISSLGNDWDEARVMRFNADAPTTSAVRDFDQRLTRVDQIVATTTAEVADSSARWQTAQAEVARCKLEMRDHDAALVAEYDTLQALTMTLATQRAALEHRSEKQGALAALTPKLEIERRAIGAEWSDERLRAVEFSRTTLQKLQDFYAQFSANQTAARRAEEYATELELQYADAQRQSQQTTGKNLSEIQQRLNELDQLEEIVVRLRGCFTSRMELNAHADRLRRDQAELRGMNDRNTTRQPSMEWLVWVSAAAGCALAVWFATLGFYVPACLTVAIISLPLLTLKFHSGDSQKNRAGTQPDALSSEASRVKRDLSINATEIRTNLVPLQLSSEANAVDLDVYQLSLSRERQGCNARLVEARGLIEVERVLLSRLDEAREHQRLAREQISLTHTAWQEWCVALSLPSSLQPSAVSDYIKDIECTAITLRACEGFHTVLAPIHAEIARWEFDVLPVMERFGVPRVQGRDLVEQLATIAGNSKTAMQRHARLAVAQLAERQALEYARGKDSLVKQARAEEHAFWEVWRAWITQRDCPVRLPVDAMSIIEQIKKLQLTAATKQSSQDALGNLLQRTDGFEAEVSLLHHNLRLSPDDLQADQMIEVYSDHLEQHTIQSAALCSLEEQQQSLLTKLSMTATRLTGVRTEIQTLCVKWNAADADNLERFVEVTERRDALERIIQQVRGELERHSGSEISVIETLLVQADPLSWDQQVNETRLRISEQQEIRTQLLEARVRARNDCERMSTDMNLARLGLEREQLQAQLRQHTRRWIQASLAHELLAGTLAEYEKTKGPEVFRHASALFRTVTSERYHHVKAVEGRMALRVLTAMDEACDAAQLSRGTQEQLYLAVRLGLARAHGERTARLPIVMDDVLVNADPERARAVVNVLTEVSAHHQVIYLTCHRTTVDLFQSVNQAVSVIEMPRLEPATVVLDVAAQPTDNTYQQRRDVLGKLKDRVLQVLGTHGGWVTSLELKPSLGVGSSVSDSEYLRTMATLETEGQIVQDGEKRSRRFRLTEVTATALI